MVLENKKVDIPPTMDDNVKNHAAKEFLCLFLLDQFENLDRIMLTRVPQHSS